MSYNNLLPDSKPCWSDTHVNGAGPRIIVDEPDPTMDDCNKRYMGIYEYMGSKGYAISRDCTRSKTPHYLDNNKCYGFMPG